MSQKWRRWVRYIGEAILPLALLAGLLALVLPSRTLATNSDLILAALVLATALGIDPERFLQLRDRWRLVLALSVAPLCVLAPAAWLLGRLFASPAREGILALGLAPTEVAAGGLVTLAGGDAALALAAITGSLVFSALAGPLLFAVLLSGSEVTAGAGELVARFVLVVIFPLLAGIGVRLIIPGLVHLKQEFAATSTLAVVALVYASLSGASDQAALVPAVLGSVAFLVISGVFALVGSLAAGGEHQSAVPLIIGMRDFAVAAALANEAFGPPAAAIAGVYGVLVLIAGAAASRLSR